MTQTFSTDCGASIHESVEVVRRLDRLKAEVADLCARIEQIRRHDGSAIQRERHRSEPPYASGDGQE